MCFLIYSNYFLNNANIINKQTTQMLIELLLILDMSLAEK